jgi:hypothetical protein
MSEEVSEGWVEWAAWYASDGQGVYALLVVPALFLVYLLLEGRRGAQHGAQRFVFLYCLVFSVETLLDPISTGLLVKGAAALAGRLTSLLFVLLGDLRVLLLVFYCCGAFSPRQALLRASLFTVAVPILAFLANALLDATLGPVSGQVLWLCHELLFVTLSVWLLTRYGGNPFLRRVLLFVAAYYGLWATSDILILNDVDLGWLLRALPNQLYYAFFVPFVWFAARAHPPELSR